MSVFVDTSALYLVLDRDRAFHAVGYQIVFGATNPERHQTDPWVRP